MRYVAILNDGTFSGDAPLLDWTRIPVRWDEAATITLPELIKRWQEVITTTEEGREEWEEFFKDDVQYIKRAFILEQDFVERLLNSTLEADIGGDSDAYATSSALICVMKEFSVRIVE